MSNEKHLLHAKSKQVTDGKAALPSYDRIEYGEIAVNYAKGHETLAIRNSRDEIVTFTSASAQAEASDEVEIGSGQPLNDNVEIFIDESVDPISVEVYSKQQIDTQLSVYTGKDEELEQMIADKITVGSTPASSDTTLIVDESVDTGIEVYTKAEVDAIIAKLKQDNNLV